MNVYLHSIGKLSLFVPSISVVEKDYIFDERYIFRKDYEKLKMKAKEDIELDALLLKGCIFLYERYNRIMGSYVLKDGVSLCGYKLLPYAIKKVERGKDTIINFFDKKTFEILKLCEGEIDFDIFMFDDKDRELLARAEKFGFIEKSKKQKKVEYVYYDNRYINTVHWSITGRCNAKCKHCYMAAPDAKYGELDSEIIFRMIDDMALAGVLNVTLTGGECLVRHDFLDIVDRLLKYNINIETIYTNGFLVNEKLLNELDKRGIHPEFNMSFDGVGYHDYMRGIIGAEEKTNKALSLCYEKGFSTGVEMCIFDKNKHTLRETINHLASLHVRGIKTNPVYNSTFWQKYGDGKDISVEELYDIYLDYIPHFYEDKKPMNVMLGGFFLDGPKRDHYIIPGYKMTNNLETTCVCGHVRNVMYISAEGRALPCMSLSDEEVQKKFPLLQEEGFKKCLQDSFYMKFIDTTAKEIIDKNDRCKNCEYNKNCFGGCRAAAYGDHKDLYGIDEYSCMMFKGGYVKKIEDTVRKAINKYGNGVNKF